MLEPLSKFKNAYLLTTWLNQLWTGLWIAHADVKSAALTGKLIISTSSFFPKLLPTLGREEMAISSIEGVVGTEAQRGQVTCPRSHASLWQSQASIKLIHHHWFPYCFLCAKHCAKIPTGIFSRGSYLSSLRKVLLLVSYYKWRNWSLLFSEYQWAPTLYQVLEEHW